MKKMAFKKALLMTTVIGLFAGVSSVAVQAENLTFKDKDAFGEAVKGYLFENPEVIFESIERHRAQQEQDKKKNAEIKMEEHLPYLTSADNPSVGNPDGDITVIEFFDYNCGYCKRALPDIQSALDGDKNLRVVLKDMAILGPSSRKLALWSLAAHKQGKYFEYHVALMNHNGSKEEDGLMKLATQLGMDAEKLKADANSNEIAAQLDKDTIIAGEVGVQGTPAFIIGTQFIPGYVGADGLKQIIAEERAKLSKNN